MIKRIVKFLNNILSSIIVRIAEIKFSYEINYDGDKLKEIIFLIGKHVKIIIIL
ncbi:hypothetical protein UT300018_19570 [Clostridium faecium]